MPHALPLSRHSRVFRFVLERRAVDQGWEGRLVDLAERNNRFADLDGYGKMRRLIIII